MKQYTIEIQETVYEAFDVKASNADAALEIAERKYKDGEFVLEPGEVTYRELKVILPESEETDWKEF
ncbi:MAG: DpnD/PcfM family protein [Anaerovoracaceae bacterium]